MFAVRCCSMVASVAIRPADLRDGWPGGRASARQPAGRPRPRLPYNSRPRDGPGDPAGPTAPPEAAPRAGPEHDAPVAQPDRVVASEAIGRGFESLQARHPRPTTRACDHTTDKWGNSHLPLAFGACCHESLAPGGVTMKRLDAIA